MSKYFVNTLKDKGYEVSLKKLGGGYVNTVNLVTATNKKTGELHQYVLKKYTSKDDLNSMIRGYDKLSLRVKTPTILYMDKDRQEVVYDLVKGTSIGDMIKNRDKRVVYAMKLLGEQLEKLHTSKKRDTKYKKGDSPDEKKIMKSVIKVYNDNKDLLDHSTANKIFHQIKKYVPKNSSIIHGDAHLGNFIYTDDNELYFIDPDDVKISDHNVDVGRIVSAIDQIRDEGSITDDEANNLRELFLEVYKGEDLQGVAVTSLRQPLIVMKNIKNKVEKKHLQARERINKVLKSLEIGVTSILFLAVTIVILLKDHDNPTGRVIDTISDPSAQLYIGVLSFLAILLIYTYFQKIKNKKD